MRVLVWHVHGSWTTSFVQGPHEYLIPTSAGRDGDGRGRATTCSWPANAVEVPLPELGNTDVDVVLLQSVRDLQLLRTWGGRRAGVDVPAVFLEHNTPSGSGAFTEHPLANQHDIPIVHVTHFNNMMWDCGRAPTTVIEHGIVDPGHQYSGRAERAGVVINDPLRRGRSVGTDLLPKFASVAPLDVFGRNVIGLGRTSLGRHGRLRAHENLPQGRMHAQLAECRAYLHTPRWTSLGLSLLEAMHLGMPVVALATTEVPRAVPPEVGSISTRPDELAEALRALIADPDLAHAKGQRAREWALERYGLKRFLSRWDRVLENVVASRS
jgi:hypothetical protein